MEARANKRVVNEGSGADIQRPGPMLMDLCAHKYSTAIACMLLDECRAFVGCYVSAEVRTAAETDFVLAFASQVLDLESDISESAEVIASANSSKKRGM